MITLLTLAAGILGVLIPALQRDMARATARKSYRLRRVDELRRAVENAQVCVAAMQPAFVDAGRAARNASDQLDAMAFAIHAAAGHLRSPYEPSKKQKGRPE